MEVTTRLVVEGACVCVFVLSLTFGGVRIPSRMLVSMRYVELRDARFPASRDLPRPDFRAFMLAPLLAVAVLGVPALTVFMLLRTNGALPSPALSALALAPGPLLAVVAWVFTRRSPWLAVRRELSLAARLPEDRREPVFQRAFDADPQLHPAAGAVGEDATEGRGAAATPDAADAETPAE